VILSKAALNSVSPAERSIKSIFSWRSRQTSAKQPTLREILEANTYRIKVDKYSFADDYETVLGIHEALMSVKGWLLEKQKELKIDKDGGTRLDYFKEGRDSLFEELLAELKDISLPSFHAQEKAIK
jgi:hypothetical protein